VLANVILALYLSVSKRPGYAPPIHDLSSQTRTDI
jgi:hypothetical protein